MQRDGVAAMPAVHRILLTATPLANNLPELYSLATLARPGALGTRDEFRDDFERPILAGWRRRWACSGTASSASSPRQCAGPRSRRARDPESELGRSGNY